MREQARVGLFNTCVVPRRRSEAYVPARHSELVNVPRRVMSCVSHLSVGWAVPTRLVRFARVHQELQKGIDAHYIKLSTKRIEEAS